MENILDRISKKTAELSKGERAVAKAILDEPAKTSSENIAELAKRAGVSQPTVCRFCTRFGASGYREFRLTLSATVKEDPQSPQKSIRSGDSVSDVVSKVFSCLSAALKDAERNIDNNVLARAIDLVSQATRIVIGAQGLSIAPAADFSLILLNMGMHCENYSDPTLLLRAVASLHSGDLLIVISSTGESRDLPLAVGAAKDNGVSVLALCPANTSLAEMSPLVMKCGYRDENEGSLITGRIASMAVLQAISAGVSLRRADMVRPISDKIRKAVLPLRNKMNATDQPGQPDATLQNAAQPLTADAPITVLNWNR